MPPRWDLDPREAWVTSKLSYEELGPFEVVFDKSLVEKAVVENKVVERKMKTSPSLSLELGAAAGDNPEPTHSPSLLLANILEEEGAC